jgi:glutathione S-transferase
MSVCSQAKSMDRPHPVIYTFRRCPYAIRARMAIYYAGIQCELREVVLKDKPSSMTTLSEKGTVPVLLSNGQVIDESLEIIFWALSKSDPDNWLQAINPDSLVTCCDGYFKFYLDRYKYFDRYQEQDQAFYFNSAQKFLEKLEQQLALRSTGCRYLHGERMTWVDVAIFPFVRQFAFVDKSRFDQLDFPYLQSWLEDLLQSKLFLAVMNKYAQWHPDDEKVYFPET